jgi:hypothetical protein
MEDESEALTPNEDEIVKSFAKFVFGAFLSRARVTALVYGTGSIHPENSP